MLVVLGDVDHVSVCAREPTTGERVLARIRAGKLDRDLATGTTPETSAPLALRAQLLVRPVTRAWLARTLCDIVDQAARPGRPPRSLRIPIDCRSVNDAAAELRTLIERLLTPAPLPARGIAQVMVLLSDGLGPLYDPRCRHALPTVVHQAIDALDPLTTW